MGPSGVEKISNQAEFRIEFINLIESLDIKVISLRYYQDKIHYEFYFRLV